MSDSGKVTTVNRVAQPHPWADRAAGMMLAAAVGDALGWPHERRDRTRRTQSTEHDTRRFTSWERIAGNRFRPFTEVIGAGDYSDDTQMIIAVARSLTTAGAEWQAWLERVEWPFLLLYERGAGASVKRACKAWSRGRAPWEAGAGDVRRYFATGANGAAMRVAPHVIRHHADTSFERLASDVVRDAATTHGHPRALMGAMVHAHALWLSMRQPAPLSYGWLIEALLDDAAQWHAPIYQQLPNSWHRGAEEALGEPFEHLWQTTSREVVNLLASAQKELKGGAVSAPSAFLQAQGLTSVKTRGSGTLCAVASAYLAARSAASPQHALASAARLEGADTDTLASMAASLLGAALGQEWLGSLGHNVQDRSLLVDLSHALLEPPAEPSHRLPTATQARKTLASFSEELVSVSSGSNITVPYRRSGIIKSQEKSTAGEWEALQTCVLTNDGQRLHTLHSVHRAAREVSQVAAPPATRLLGTYLPVSDVLRVRHILESVFGLSADRYGNDWAAYGNLIVAEDSAPENTPTAAPRAQLRVACQDPEEVWQRAQKQHLPGAANRTRMYFSFDVDSWLTVTVNLSVHRGHSASQLTLDEDA